MSAQDSQQSFGELDVKVVLVNGDVVEVTSHRLAIETAQYWEETLDGTKQNSDIEVRSLEWAQEHQPPVDTDCFATWERV
jgi:hypothetical protein